MARTTKRLTTAFGRPVDDDQNSLTAGDPGPVLLQDVHLVDARIFHSLGHLE